MTLLAERDRWVLWLPVGLGSGVALYFGLPVEPVAWSGAVALAVAILVAALWRRNPPAMLAALAVATMAAGFAAAQWRAAAVAAPVMTQEMRGTLVGRIVAVEPTERGRRIIVVAESFARLRPDELPARVRVTLGAEPPLAAGDRVRAPAMLRPPPAPAAPGAVDFQRMAWFEGIGGVGFALGRAEVIEPGEDGGAGARFAAWLDALRGDLHARVVAVVPGAAGAVASALLTGIRGDIPEAADEAMRDSGLAHLLSISGLHMSLVAGTVFLLVRGGLALIPAVALRHPIKKWAALAALLAAGFYTLLAGAPVPTQRAFVTVAVVAVAVLVDRTAISLRVVGWAAAAILLLRPDSLLGASFQMSFAAVVALVAVWETWGRHLATRGDTGLAARAAAYVFGIAMTSLVAGLATTPYALYHFDRLVHYGIAANMVAVPLTAVWIMPLGLAALLLMPFGLEAVALVPMGWGVEAVLQTAAIVAAWPGAVALVPAMPDWALGAVTLGGLWLALWRRPWRLAGLAPVVAGLASLAFAVPPDVLASEDGRLLAVRAADGGYHVSSGRRGAFMREMWLRRAGSEDWETFPAGASADGRLVCDAEGCLYRTAAGEIVALAWETAAMAEDCRLATIVVAIVPVRRRCPSARLVIDSRDLRRDGGHALWLRPDGPRVATVDGERGARPWVSSGR